MAGIMLLGLLGLGKDAEWGQMGGGGGWEQMRLTGVLHEGQRPQCKAAEDGL